MRKNKVVVDDAPAAPALTPDLIAKIKKEDMKQAVVERFSRKAVVQPSAPNMRKRSPYWQRADEEC